MKDKALKTALTLQTANILVNDGLVKLDGKTSSAVKLLNKMTSQGDKVLVVLPKTLTAPIRSLRNLSAVLTTTAPRLNVLQVVSADKIIITKEALKGVEQRLTKPKEVKTPIVPKKKKVAKTEKK